MKKEYIKPEIEVVDVEMVTMISTSDKMPVLPGEGDEFAPGRQDRRGTWGNLWSEE